MLGQVMSYNDPKWSVFWSRGAADWSPTYGYNWLTGKHVGEDSTRSRVDESYRLLVIEERHAVSEDQKSRQRVMGLETLRLHSGGVHLEKFSAAPVTILLKPPDGRRWQLGCFKLTSR
jgi:hypothetical protein